MYCEIIDKNPIANVIKKYIEEDINVFDNIVYFRQDLIEEASKIAPMVLIRYILGHSLKHYIEKIIQDNGKYTDKDTSNEIALLYFISISFSNLIEMDRDDNGNNYDEVLLNHIIKNKTYKECLNDMLIELCEKNIEKVVKLDTNFYGIFTEEPSTTSSFLNHLFEIKHEFLFKELYLKLFNNSNDLNIEIKNNPKIFLDEIKNVVDVYNSKKELRTEIDNYLFPPNDIPNDLLSIFIDYNNKDVLSAVSEIFTSIFHAISNMSDPFLDGSLYINDSSFDSNDEYNMSYTKSYTLLQYIQKVVCESNLDFYLMSIKVDYKDDPRDTVEYNLTFDTLNYADLINIESEFNVQKNYRYPSATDRYRLIRLISLLIYTHFYKKEYMFNMNKLINLDDLSLDKIKDKFLRTIPMLYIN